MIDILIHNPLLAVMIVLVIGAGIGQIRFGPLRFGAAGALFAGLAIGCLHGDIGSTLAIIQTLGLALFVYTVGLAAGSTFLKDLKHQWTLMVLAIVVLVIVAIMLIFAGSLIGLDGPLLAGTFAGALTSTPALAAAQTAANSDPALAVGYALAYPVGVILAIMVVAATIVRHWPGTKDSPSLAGSGLKTLSVVVDRPMYLNDIPGWEEQEIKASYLRRDRTTRVIHPDEELKEGDVILLVGPEQCIDNAASTLGHPAVDTLTDSRADVDFRRFLVSNPTLTGKTIGQIDLPHHLGGAITRVKRGDLDMVAADNLALQPGDRVLAVVPREKMDECAQFFGDSERKISEIDSMGFSLGLSLGLLIGLVHIPLPGGSSFSFGAAAGPLIMGMILGALHRSGPIQWDLPTAANLTIRQLGLLLFLAAVGLSSGPAFAASMFTWTGIKVGITAAIIVAITSALFLAGGRLLNLSAQRVVGAFAGLIGQPAILSYATSRSNDERVESGYVALFALTMIIKITIVPFIVG